MFTVTSLDKKGAKALYMQLYEAIKQKIIEGELEADEMLPSKRALSVQLGVSLKTIENAYGQLDLEGFIYSVEKKGYFVSVLPEYRLPDKNKKKYVCKPVSKSYDVDASVTDPSKQEFPLATWSKLMRDVMADEGNGILYGVSFIGHPKLRAAIASYLEEFRGMNVSPDQIVVGAGTEVLFTRLFQLLGPDRIFGLEDPGTSKTRSVFKYYHVPYRPVPVDDEGISMKHLNASDCNIIYVTPAHHYPLGHVTSAARRVELLFWANEKPGRYIIESEYDCEFRYVGMPVPTMQSIDVRDKVIYMSSFNRYVGNAVRMSYMVLPHNLMDRYMEENSFSTSTISPFEQLLMARFIDDGHLERQINHLKHYYAARREHIIRAFKAHPLSEKARLIEYASGSHFLLKLRTEVPDLTFKNMLLEHRIKVRFVSEYCDIPDQRYNHMLLINYTGIREEQFSEFMDLLYDRLNSAEKKDNRNTEKK